MLQPSGRKLEHFHKLCDCLVAHKPSSCLDGSTVLENGMVEGKTFELIEEYRKTELLWNPKHPQYFNRILKNDAWKELGKAINMSSEECRTKMNNLQASLRREKQKITKSLGTGKGADEVYVSSWCFFKSLQFLLDKNKPRETLDTVPSQDGSKDAVEPQNTQVEDMPENSTGTEKRQIACEKSSTASRSFNRKRKINPSNDKLDQAFTILTSSASASTLKEDNVCTIFGKLVAKKMETYTPHTQTAVQQALMNILIDADKGYYDNKHMPSEPSHTHGYHSASQVVQYASQGSQPLTYYSQQQKHQYLSAPRQSPHESHFQHPYRSPNQSYQLPESPHYPTTSPYPPSIHSIHSPPFSGHSESNTSMDDLLSL